MNDPLRTIEPGTALNPALLNSSSLISLNLESILSHQLVFPGLFEINFMSLMRKYKSIDFLTH